MVNRFILSRSNACSLRISAEKPDRMQQTVVIYEPFFPRQFILSQTRSHVVPYVSHVSIGANSKITNQGYITNIRY